MTLFAAGATRNRRLRVGHVTGAESPNRFFGPITSEEPITTMVTEALVNDTNVDAAIDQGNQTITGTLDGLLEALRRSLFVSLRWPRRHSSV